MECESCYLNVQSQVQEEDVNSSSSSGKTKYKLKGLELKLRDKKAVVKKYFEFLRDGNILNGRNSLKKETYFEVDERLDKAVSKEKKNQFKIQQ